MATPPSSRSRLAPVALGALFLLAGLLVLGLASRALLYAGVSYWLVGDLVALILAVSTVAALRARRNSTW